MVELIHLLWFWSAILFKVLIGKDMIILKDLINISPVLVKVDILEIFLQLKMVFTILIRKLLLGNEKKIWILLEEQMKNMLDAQKKNKKNFKEEKTILIKHVKHYKVVKKELLLLPVGLVRKLPTISWHVK